MDSTNKKVMESHEAAFKSWLHRQGDMSAKSIYVLTQRAFFDGAAYGVSMAMAINNETLTGENHDG